MNSFRIGMVLLALGLLAACAHQTSDNEPAAEPAWVAGNPEDYPVADYLIGRGQAESGQQARNRARADLAKIFEVGIDEVTRDVQAFRDVDDDEVDGGAGELAVERQLRTRTDQVLEGVEIVDQWRDPEAGSRHALAAIPRVQATQRLRGQIADLDDATGTWVQRARESDDLLTRIDAATRAVALQRQSQALQRQLRAIGRTGGGVDSKWNLEQLVADRDELRSRLRVAVVAAGRDQGRLARTVRGVLSDAGLRVVDDGEYRFRVRLDDETIGPRNGWYWRIGSLQAELVDAEGSTHGGWRWPIKVAASETALLDQRLYDDVAERLEVGLPRALAGIEGGDE